MPAPNISTASSDVEMLVTCMPASAKILMKPLAIMYEIPTTSERDEREQRRAVDDQQQDQHQQAGHRQQREVGRLEAVPQVGLQRRRAGDLCLQPIAAVDDLAHLFGERR